jgi:hypothetical protein
MLQDSVIGHNGSRFGLELDRSLRDLLYRLAQKAAQAYLASSIWKNVLSGSKDQNKIFAVSRPDCGSKCIENTDTIKSINVTNGSICFL